MNVLLFVMSMEKVMGKDFEEGLTKLKTHLEGKEKR